MPAPAHRRRRARNGRGHPRALLAGVVLIGLAESHALAQAPLAPTGPAPMYAPRRVGPIHRKIDHIKHEFHDKFVGYPEYFVEPPLGSSLYGTLGMMKARADYHDFTLYRSDFVDGTATLAPSGAERLTRMTSRLNCWLGAIVVEWTPDRPGLDLQRRDAILALLNQAGQPIGPERVAIGASPYPGRAGDDGARINSIMIQRDVESPLNYPLVPIPVSLPSGAGGAP